METTTLKSLELITIKRGSHKVVYTWDNGQTSSVIFSNKKDAKDYLSYIKTTITPNMNVSVKYTDGIRCYISPCFSVFS